MRGHDEQTAHMFSYLSPEQRVPADHPLRAVRALTDEALQTTSARNSATTICTRRTNCIRLPRRFEPRGGVSAKSTCT